MSKAATPTNKRAAASVTAALALIILAPTLTSPSDSIPQLPAASPARTSLAATAAQGAGTTRVSIRTALDAQQQQQLSISLPMTVTAAPVKPERFPSPTADARFAVAPATAPELTITQRHELINTNSSAAAVESRTVALMRLSHSLQLAAEQAYVSNHHARAAAQALTQARADRDTILTQAHELSTRIEVLEAENRELQIRAATAAAPQPPPLINTTPPPLPAPTTVAPTAQATTATASAPTQLVNPTEALLQLINNSLSPREPAELRSEAHHNLTAEGNGQITLQSTHSAVVHQLDVNNGELLSTRLTLRPPEAAEFRDLLHDALEARLGPAAVSVDATTTYYGAGVDVNVTQNEEDFVVTLLFTSLNARPIHVFDVPTDTPVEPAPLITRYD